MKIVLLVILFFIFLSVESFATTVTDSVSGISYYPYTDFDSVQLRYNSSSSNPFFLDYYALNPGAFAPKGVLSNLNQNVNFLGGDASTGYFNFYLYHYLRYSTFLIQSNQLTHELTRFKPILDNTNALRCSFSNISSQVADIDSRFKTLQVPSFSNISTKLAKIEQELSSVNPLGMSFLFGLAGVICGGLFWKIVIR